MILPTPQPAGGTPKPPSAAGCPGAWDTAVGDLPGGVEEAA